MDGSRFDRWSRTLADGTTRRRTFQGVAGGTVAGLLAHFKAEETSAACVKPGKRGCKGPRNQKCCGGARCQGGTKTREGRCVCTGSLTKCGTACVNTQTDKRHCGRCNKKCAAGHTCQQSRCTSELGCRAGFQICHVPSGEPLPPCPGTANPECQCMTDVEGTPRCVDTTIFVCQNCFTNANCGPGMVCVNHGLPTDRCCNEDGETGRVCVGATCGGKS